MAYTSNLWIALQESGNGGVTIWFYLQACLQLELELKGGGRGGVEGGGRKIIWSVFSRVPALCSLLQPGLCVPIYKAPCARARGKLNHVFFICSVLPLQRSQNLSCREEGNTHQGVFLSKSLFFSCLWKAIQWLFFPLVVLFFLNL